MKRYIKSFLPVACSLLLVTTSFAQQINNPEDNVPVTVPVTTPQVLTYPDLINISNGLPVNYVRTQVPDAPLTDIPAGTNTYIRQTTQYVDGLGRPLQEVAKKVHADGYDLVKHHVYDATGNEKYHYLPYTLPEALSTGKLSRNANSGMHQFYDNLGPDEQPYGRTETDNSPLNRVMKQLAPGKSWVGSNRGVVYSYKSNRVTVYSSNGIIAHDYKVLSDFPIFTIGADPTSMPQYAGGYESNSLLITEVKDEDGNISQEVKDKAGRLLFQRKLFKKQTLPFPAVVPFEALAWNFVYTAYVYDDLGRLRVVMPPEACKPEFAGVTTSNTPIQITTASLNWPVNPEKINGLCYQYFYDNRSRLIEKKIPGKEREYYVYDKRDRQVLYQDGNMRTHYQWAFVLYDALDRPTCNGLYGTDAPESRTDMQAHMDNAIVYPVSSLLYYLKKYDQYHVYPQAIGDSKILGYTYYDNYNELSSFGYNSNQFDNITLPSNGTVVASVLSDRTKGMATGSKVRILNTESPGSDYWLTSVNYYDDKGRLIQTQSKNHKGGLDISSNIYYFQGMLWKNILHHQNPSAEAIPGTTDGPITDFVVVKTFERNLSIGGGNDQVYRVTQKIGNGATYDLAYYEYDHLGRVTVKQFPAANVLQEYNIRGFLNHIKVANFNNNAANGLDPHIFEEKLYYDTGFATKLYNGNIAGITWKKAGSQAAVEAYGYSYDQLNRLNHAEYRRTPYNATSWAKNQYDYTASNITYDLNGNIQSMDQEAPNPNPMHMDQLTYSYATNSNRLIKVKDNVPSNTTDLLPDFKDGGDEPEEYDYDENGNMTLDKNKHIESITYSSLNKPEQIVVTGKGTITYMYDAAGNRLQKKVQNTGTNETEVYDYIGSFVYRNNILQYLLNEEGRARPIAIASASNGQFDTKFVYDYFIKDHLGNVRSTVTAEPMDGIYLAKHEIASANTEQLLFDNIPGVRQSKPGSTTADDAMAARLDGGDPQRRIGTAIMLRTMPGDRFNLSVDAYYDGEYNKADEAGTEDVISSLMGALTGGTYAGMPLKEMPESIRTINQVLGKPELASQLNKLLNNSNNPNAPRAHLNYLFFNEKMELIPGNSGSVQVPVNPQGWVNIKPGKQIGNAPTIINGGYVSTQEPGYVIIYIDNQSIGKEVWFDNLMIGHYKGKVVEENHYYPFGLTLQTSQAAGAADQPHKYQGIELEKHFGLETYETFFRGMDPQLGRFNQIDPKSELDFDLSPYVSMANNPVVNIDPLGDNPILVGLLEAAVEAVEVEEVIGATEVIKGGTATLDRGDGLAHQHKVMAQSKQAWDAINSSLSTVIAGAPAMGRFAAKTAAAVKQLAQNYEKANKTNTKPTSRAARREAMRKQGIPTSQQPKKQRNNKSGREYDYDVPEEGGGTKTKSVQERTMDRGHENDPHWEAGDVKVRDGEVQQNQHGSPKLENSKSKVEYEN